MGAYRPTMMWELARAVIDSQECPRCGAPVKSKCRNLRSSVRTFIAEPHRERYPDGTRNQTPENMALIGRDR